MDDGGAPVVGREPVGVSDGRADEIPLPVLGVTEDEIVTANRAVVEFFSADDESTLVGTDPTEYVHDNDWERLRTRLRSVIDRGERVSSLEYRFRLPDGRIKSTLVAMAPTTVDGDDAARLFLTDVTKHRHTQRDLRVERRFLRRVIDAMAAVVFVFDERGQLVLANDAAVERTGYSEAEIDEYGLGAIVPESQRDRIPEIWTSGGGSGPDRTEIEIRTADDERIPHEFSGVSIAGNETGDRYMIAVARDVSERKRRERKLRRQNDRLTEFAQMVSHDLRNPLEVARGRLELLEDADPEAVDRIEESLDRMDDLIGDVLALAQEGQVVDELDAVSVASAATECWSTVATGRAELRVEDDCWIRADRGRLRSLLENLFDNSTTHAVEDPGSDDLTVRVGPIHRGGDAVGFYVEDDGRGIDIEERERIFESGFSTAEDGTGFGLVIVDQIARAHNWSITITSADPEFTGLEADPDAAPGTRFEFLGVDVVER